MGFIARTFLLFLCLEPASSLAAPEPVFTLERSTNRNLVVYEADFSSHEPIHPYWRMLEEDGHHEELTTFERTHLYGVMILERTADEIKFGIRALPDHPILVKLRNGTPVVSMPDIGIEFAVKRFYVRLKGLLGLSVSSIEVLGDGDGEFAELVPNGEHRLVVKALR